jgi:Circadian oscillating protein COP23
MRLRLFGQVLTWTSTAIALLGAFGLISSISQPSYAGSQTFYCSTSKNIPATMARTPRGSVPMILWAANDSFPAPWNNPQRRCLEVSRRFQKNYENGTLRYLTTGTLRGQPVICGATSKYASCKDSTVLFTLKPGRDANETLQSILDIRGLAAGRVPIENDDTVIDFDLYLNNVQVETNGSSNRNFR